MQNIKRDIKERTFKRVYLLYGEETYLKRTYKNMLKEAIIGSDDSINYHSFEGKGINSKEVIDIAETLPFFSDHRLISIENSGFFKNTCEELIDYIKEIPETTVLLFIESEVDRRGKLYKKVKEHGYPAEMGRQTDKKLIPWILKILAQEGKKITEPDMQLLLTKAGNDMENIAMELDKLISYTLGREAITTEDIEAICSVQTMGRIFDMITAISERNQKKALDLYYDLLTLKEPPMRILFLIARQFNLMMQVKELASSNIDYSSIAKQTGLQNFLIGKYAAQAKRYETGFLRQAIADCIETEEAVKTGQLEDRLGVELLIIRYSCP